MKMKTQFDVAIEIITLFQRYQKEELEKKQVAIWVAQLIEDYAQSKIKEHEYNNQTVRRSHK
jgi:hypothetical protein